MYGPGKILAEGEINDYYNWIELFYLHFSMRLVYYF